MNASKIKIEDEWYAEWYRDINENEDDYDGKTFIIKGRVALSDELPEGQFAFGRHVMTCCEADIQFAGLLAYYAGAEKLSVGDWIEIMERMRSKWNCYDFQHFVNGVKKENPRHISKQLRAIEQFLDAQAPDKSLVAEVMKVCCKNFRYQFSQFRTVYELTKAGRSLPGTEGAVNAFSSSPVDYKSLDVYGRAFQDRVARSEKEAVG